MIIPEFHDKKQTIMNIFWFRRDLRIDDNKGFLEALSSDKNVSMPAVLGTALSPGFTALFVYVIAHFTWKWGGGTNNDLSLIEKLKTSLSIMFNRNN